MTDLVREVLRHVGLVQDVGSEVLQLGVAGRTRATRDVGVESISGEKEGSVKKDEKGSLKKQACHSAMCILRCTNASKKV